MFSRPTPTTRPAVLRSTTGRRLRRAIGRHRTVIAVLVVSLGALATITAARPPLPPLVPVAVAAHDLVPGQPLTRSDVASARAAPDSLPDGAYGPAEVPIGRLVAAPARRGEVLTDVAVIGPGLVEALPRGDVLTTLTVRALVPSMVQVGDMVTVVASDPRGQTGTGVVADSATVVWLPDGGAGGELASSPVQVSTLVVAVPETEALDLTAASTTQVLDILVRAAAPR